MVREFFIYNRFLATAQCQKTPALPSVHCLTPLWISFSSDGAELVLNYDFCDFMMG